MASEERKLMSTSTNFLRASMQIPGRSLAGMMSNSTQLDKLARPAIDETRCYICESPFTFFGNKRFDCRFCRKPVCDEHSRGRRDGDRICDDCCTRLVKQEFKESDDEAHLFKLKMLLELSTKAKEEQRQELLCKEAESSKLKAQIENLRKSRWSAEVQAKDQIDQETQRNEKHQQVLNSLNQALEDAKSSKKTIADRVHDVEGNVETLRQEIAIVKAQLTDLNRNLTQGEERLKQSVPLIDLKTLVCKGCRKLLKQNYRDSLFNKINEDILVEFFGDCDEPEPGHASSSSCSCIAF
mmetsp:Transcript_16562/g.29823  ORF Transcript_16562/g.29823 Transcript_16562/m.29823 type:complete len:297 (+) Transcript_16562:267-1157(+)